jgi:hypothetical protein
MAGSGSPTRLAHHWSSEVMAEPTSDTYTAMYDLYGLTQLELDYYEDLVERAPFPIYLGGPINDSVMRELGG